MAATRGMKQLVIALAVAGSLSLPAIAAAAALGRAACPLAPTPQFTADFVALKGHLGAAMGEPMDCMRAEGSPDAVQPTTAGFAYRRGDGPPTFTTGREFWALTPSGLEHWIGTPHSGFNPPAAPATATEPVTLPPTGTYATVEAVTVLEVDGRADGELVVRRGASSYRLQRGVGCAEASIAIGWTAFIRSPGEFAGEGSELLVSGGGGACPIVESGAS